MSTAVEGPVVNENTGHPIWPTYEGAYVTGALNDGGFTVFESNGSLISSSSVKSMIAPGDSSIPNTGVLATDGVDIQKPAVLRGGGRDLTCASTAVDIVISLRSAVDPR